MIQPQTQKNLKNLNSWRVGGPAEYYLRPSTQQELIEALMWADQNKKNVTHLSGGSNVLVHDEGIKGLVLDHKALNHFETYYEKGQFFIRAESGVSKKKLMNLFLEESLAPALFLSGIPGALSGGIVMNAGVREELKPREFCEIIHSLTVLKKSGSGYKRKTYLQGEISWSYRKSKNWQPGVIVEALLSWPDDKIEKLREQVTEAQSLRGLKQPLDQPSCGSTFRNPTGDKSAGALIEAAGLKGYQIGGAMVSPKHANFLVTRPGAKAIDFYKLIQHIQKLVYDQFKIELQTEIVYLGDWGS